jgi:hypothetical protein
MADNRDRFTKVLDGAGVANAETFRHALALHRVRDTHTAMFGHVSPPAPPKVSSRSVGGRCG